MRDLPWVDVIACEIAEPYESMTPCEACGVPVVVDPVASAHAVVSDNPMFLCIPCRDDLVEFVRAEGRSGPREA